MTHGERLLETLEKYGEQAKEVQLTLLRRGSSVSEETSRTKVGRYQPCPPLRRKDAGARMRRSSGSLGLHRQSLPPLSCSRQEAEPKQEDLKRPKRKSLTLMEEARDWLDSLGKGKVYSTASEKKGAKRAEKKSSASLDISFIVDNRGITSKGKVKGQKGVKSELGHQTSCCMGNQTRVKEGKQCKKDPEANSGPCSSIHTETEDEKNKIRETIISQLVCLQDLQVQIAHVDKQIFELEESQRAKKAEQEAMERIAEEEWEQIQFWENELKAEEVYEKDLQCHFLKMKAKAVECKAKLEEYKVKIKQLDFFDPNTSVQAASKGEANTATEISAVTAKDENWQQSNRDGNVTGSAYRKFLPRNDFNPPHALVPPSQIKERRPTGPTELREWWTRWSEAQHAHSQSKKKVIHRSELTIYLGSTKV